MLNRLIAHLDGPAGIRNRILVCAFAALASLAISWPDGMAARVFWLTCALVGTSAFLLVRPSVPIRRRLDMVGMWDVIGPSLLIAYAAFNIPAFLEQHGLNVLLMIVYSAGMGTGLRLLFRHDR